MTTTDSDALPGGRVARKRRIREANILTVAAKLFAEKGYEGTSLDEIAEHLDLTKGTLYHYFDSKESLLGVCVNAGATDAITRLQEVADSFSKDESAECLRALILEQLQIIVVRAPELSRLFTERHSWPPSFRRNIKEFREQHDLIFRKVIERGIATQTFHCEDPEVARHCLHGAINFAPTWISSTPARRAASMEQIADALMCMFGKERLASPNRTPKKRATRT